MNTTVARAGALVAIGMASSIAITVPALRTPALVITIAIIGTLAWLLLRQASQAVTQAAAADGLRHANVDLAARLQAGASEAMATSERLRSVIDSAVDGIVVIDQAGRIESFNPAAERLFGYPRAEVIGRNVTLLMPSPYHEEHDGYLQRYLTSGIASIIGIGREVTARRQDGSTFPVHLSVGEMTIDGERKFTGILHDLSARVALEHKLRASEARWRAVVQSAVDGIVVIDARGRIEAFNPAAELLFGYAEHELLGRNVNVLMPSPYHEEHDRYLARYMATGEAKIIGIGREVAGRRKDGSSFPLHLSVGEITIEGERKFTGIVHDLSGRVEMEDRLREQAALAKLGEMAAVIAHEVKNPLAGIRGAMQILGKRVSEETSAAQVITEIIARIDALDQMMKDLLLFARKPNPRRVPTEIASLVESTASFLHDDPALHSVEVEVDGQAPPVAADPDMLRLVFQNLIINSAHAMQGRGKIRVEISAMDATCQIAFVDAGPGIPADIRQKIFTPFFTTKSRGSGLGLPTVKRFVEAHNGDVAIECPPAGGTTVVIRLPMGATGSPPAVVH